MMPPFPTWNLSASGILGALFGLAPLEAINRWTSHWVLLSLAYLGYLVVLTLAGATFFVQYVGVCLTEALLYRAGVEVREGWAAADLVILLGRYSLLGYIVQIFSLQILLRLLRRWPLAAQSWPLGFFTAMALTIGIVILTDQARRRWPGADRIYRLVFA